MTNEIMSSATPLSQDPRRLILWAFVCGLLWLVGIGSAAAIVLSIRARRALSERDEDRIWHDLWKVAFLIGVVGLALGVVTVLNHIALDSEPVSEIHKTISRHRSTDAGRAAAARPRAR